MLSFLGIGFSMNIANAYLCIFYNMLIAYSLYFLVMSFRSTLPWQYCNPLWSSPSNSTQIFLNHKYYKNF